MTNARCLQHRDEARRLRALARENTGPSAAAFNARAAVQQDAADACSAERRGRSTGAARFRGAVVVVPGGVALVVGP
jgi:hypothetical protein